MVDSLRANHQALGRAVRLFHLAQSVARFRQLYAVLDRQARRQQDNETDDVPPMPRRLDSKTLQAIKEQVYGIPA